MNTVIEAAEAVVEQYAMRRLKEALDRQKACGCRSCVARAKGWIDWVAGDDVTRSDIAHAGEV